MTVIADKYVDGGAVLLGLAGCIAFFVSGCLMVIFAARLYLDDRQARKHTDEPAARRDALTRASRHDRQDRW